MAKHLAQLGAKRVLRHQTPQVTDHKLQPGDKVLIWCEKTIENRIGQGSGHTE